MIRMYELPVPTLRDELKPLGDLIANGIVLATLLQWLPVFAAVVSLVWGLMRVYETYLDIRAKRHTLKMPPVAVQTMKIEVDKPGATPAVAAIAVEVVHKPEETTNGQS